MKVDLFIFLDSFISYLYLLTFLLILLKFEVNNLKIKFSQSEVKNIACFDEMLMTCTF